MQADVEMAESMLAYVMETASVLALCLDAQQRVVTVNNFAQRALPENCVGSLLAELVADFSNTEDFKWLSEQRGTIKGLTMKTASGLPEFYYFRFFSLGEGTLALGSPDFHEQTRLRNEMLGLNRDLNNLNRSLHQANAELLELNKLKNLFLGMAAHDLRNPLGVIMTHVELVLDEADHTMRSEHREFLEKCLASAHRMKQLIDGFLNVSVIESGKLRLELIPANAEEIVDGILPICRLLTEKEKVTLLVEPANDRQRLPVDVPKLQQVLLNLVGNALKYSVAGQRVWLSSQWDSGYLVFAVRDEGSGIPLEEQSRLFTAFEQGSAKKTPQERSVGLGLYIANKIVEAHGGRLWVESSPGNGATFFAALPIKRLNEIFEEKNSQ